MLDRQVRQGKRPASDRLSSSVINVVAGACLPRRRLEKFCLISLLLQIERRDVEIEKKMILWLGRTSKEEKLHHFSPLALLGLHLSWGGFMADFVFWFS
jgi:hypothetical protein